MYGSRLRALSIATLVTLAGGFALAAFYAPEDADQGFMQKILYLHVPLAIVALCGFVFGRCARSSTCAPASALGPAQLRRDPHVADLRRRGPDHRVDLGARVVGPLVGLGRADARLVPDRLPALRDLPAAALLDRGPRQAVALRERVRDHRGRVRAAELPCRPPGPVLHAPARVRDDRRRARAADEGRVLRLPAGHGAALRHAVEVRDGGEERRAAAAPLRRRLAGEPPSRPGLRSADAGAACDARRRRTLPDNAATSSRRISSSSR